MHAFQVDDGLVDSLKKQQLLSCLIALFATSITASLLHPRMTVGILMTTTSERYVET